MSKIVASSVIKGTSELLNSVKEKYSMVAAAKSPGHPAVFPGTAYYAPIIFTMTGYKIENLKQIGDFFPVLEKFISPLPFDDNWLPYLSQALDGGIAALMLEEILMLLRYAEGFEPANGYEGFLSDTRMRTLGVQLVDGRIPGFAAIIGAPADSKTAVKIVRELQERSILIFLSGKSNNIAMKDQLESEGVEMGWDSYIVPLGEDTESTIFALNWAIRAALTFGGLQGGDAQKCLEYCRDRVFAFGLGLGGIDDLKYATGAGAIAMGFPVISDTDIPEILATGVCTYEALVKEKDYGKIVQKAIEIRGIKVKLSKPPIPVLYSSAFEGERIRKEDLYIEFGGKGGTGFELLISKDLNELENKKITVTGKEIDNCVAGEKLDLAILVKVAGRNMQKDFEPILERQFHRIMNYAMGVMHIGQRNFVWIRIGKNAKEQGFKFRHLGEIIYTMIMNEYGKLVDKIEVEIITDSNEVMKHLPEAKSVYEERDKRIGEMTDESVNVFYSCLLCQSFAPNHVCIITPERLGLCGAYNWLDGKAAYQIEPTGPNQPVEKGEAIDLRLGQWKGINEFVHKYSNKSIDSFSAYSIISDPMTSCGCFECIVAILPGTCGVMIVDRNYPGMTPSGMTFSTLAGVVGGGRQNPGFLGIGINYIISDKFISAEGGLRRVVWMPSDLKERLKPELERISVKIGTPGLPDKIADETVTTDLMELAAFLTDKKHPALEMGELF